MGLAAKKFEHDYTENRIPTAMKQLEKDTQGATKNLKVEFDWKSFGEDKNAMDGAWSCWEQSLQGVSEVCKDEIGKEAVKKGLKKIKIINMKKDAPAEVSFKGGTLTMTVYFANGTQASPGWTQIQKVLEEGLD
jgi:hypothetical protein